MLRRLAVVISLLAAALTALITAPHASAATTDSLIADRVQETDTGTARTLDVPGGGYLVVHAFGAFSMVSADGRTLWQRSTQSLYQDWDVTWQDPAFPETPQLSWGTDPVNPLEFTGAGTGLVNDVNPAAVGYLDGRLDVAVAETVGSNLTSETFCERCTWPFDVPGSSLHMGTFVAVFDARTGRMLYHELDPGYVTQVAITANRLIVGDETGDPQAKNGIGAWGSVSTVRAVTVTGHQVWEYSTAVPWGRLLDLTTTKSGLAIAWSDTPTGLGVPGPPEGHVLLFDAATGAIRWQVRTPGYPILTAADNQDRELAVVELTDPAQQVGYTLTGLSYSNGSVALSLPSTGTLPVSLATGGDAATKGETEWAVGGLDATMDGAYYAPGAGRVTLADPATKKTLWSATLSATAYGSPIPAGLVLTGGEVVAGSWLGGTAPTASLPLEQADSLTALSDRTGATVWSTTGDPGDPLSLSLASSDGTRQASNEASLDGVRAVNSHQDVETYAADGEATTTTSAGPGDFLSAATASVASPHSTDLVAGNEDGDVYALDGESLSQGTEQILWRTRLPGPVHQIVRAGNLLVAAATTAVGVLDARTGRLVNLIQTPGTYAYRVTVTPENTVIVPGASLTAYDLGTGGLVWQYDAPAGADFSDAAYADGVVTAEYSNAYTRGKSATEMAAVGVSATTGQPVWTAKADPAVVERGQLWNGTIASPYIPGADGEGAAFAWQDTNGEARVDVRNIATGALLYSDTSSDLSALTQFVAGPGTGLIAVAQSGAALITPSGAEASGYPAGLAAALATTPQNDTALLVADAGVVAYPADIFTDSSASYLASETTYVSGTLVSGDFAGNGVTQVVAMPSDWLAYQVVNGQTGYNIRPYLTTVQHGLAVLTLTSSSTTSSDKADKAAAQHYPTAETSQASLRPVGEIGSEIPTTEPSRSGTVVPDPTPAAHAAASSTAPPGYSPAQIDGYLGLTGQGSGQTIAIVDAYDDPDIASDAEAFSEQYGLPGVCGDGGTAGDCFTLRVDQQDAQAGSNAGWALETSLDVEWAHAVAPKATIELVEASAPTFAALFQGVATAVASHPAAVSMSWGLPNGEFSDETYYDHFCATATTVCVVSAGDYGHPGEYPAYNPAVIAVGGTTLTLGSDNSVTSEQAWSGSGGGQSWVEPEPSYQREVQASGKRQMPDISFDADPNTGVAVYDSVAYAGQTGWWQVGGTSLSAPSWAAILADADQLRAAKGKAPLTTDAHQVIYSLPSSVIVPVTTGPDNGFCPVGCTPTSGYDEITGLGSPRSGVDVALSVTS